MLVVNLPLPELFYKFETLNTPFRVLTCHSLERYIDQTDIFSEKIHLTLIRLEAALKDGTPTQHLRVQWSFKHFFPFSMTAERVSRENTLANNEEAVAVLIKRFVNKQQIINKHVEVLLNMVSLISHGNVKGLWHLYSLVKCPIRGLKASGVPSESYRKLLTSVLMNKLLCLINLSRKMTEGDWEPDTVDKVYVRRNITSASKVVHPSTRCHNFNGRHHVSICSQSSESCMNESDKVLSPTAPEFLPPSKSDSGLVCEAPKHQTILMYVITRTPILLQTASP